VGLTQALTKHSAKTGCKHADWLTGHRFKISAAPEGPALFDASEGSQQTTATKTTERARRRPNIICLASFAGSRSTESPSPRPAHRQKQKARWLSRSASPASGAPTSPSTTSLLRTPGMLPPCRTALEPSGSDSDGCVGPPATANPSK